MKRMQYDRKTTMPTATAPSPLSNVASFDGSTSSLGNPRASSTGGGGFGFQPDLSSASPDQLKRFTDTLSNLTYSVSAGGYLFNDEAQNANSYYNKFGAGKGGNPIANKQAHDLYGEIGGFPTKAVATPALTRLRESHPGLGAGAAGPSFNERLGDVGDNPFASQAGFGSTWEGPWDIPGY